MLRAFPSLSTQFISTKRVAFQILLQKLRLPSMRLRSKLISRPVLAKEVKVKRSASVPNAGIPSANSLRVAFSIFCASLGFIRPVVRLATRVSKSMPSIKSIGSSTLPLDLDIFCPCPSRTKPCTYTVLNGTCGLPSLSLIKYSVIIIIRATQKKMMSKPVTNTLVGWKVLSAWL